MTLAPLLVSMAWLASWQRNPIWNLTFSPDGTFLAAGTGCPGRDAAQVWDLANHRESWSIDSPTAIRPVAFSPDGNSLATGHMDGTIEVWDLATRTKRFRFAPQQALLFSLGYSQDGTAILSVAATGAVKSCDATTGEVLATGQADAPNLAVLSRDGSRLAVSVSRPAGVFDGVRVYGILDGRLSAASSLPAPRGQYGVAFSRDGRLLAAADQNSVQLWDVQSEQFVGTLNHLGTQSLDFSPDGQLLATGRFGSTGLWDVASGTFLRALPEVGKSVFATAFSPNGQTLATASRDGQVHLWDVSTGRELALLPSNTPIATIFAGWLLAFSAWAIAWVRSGLRDPQACSPLVDVVLINGIVLIGLVARINFTGQNRDIARPAAPVGLGLLTGLFCLVIIWAVLGRSRWQWRLPGLLTGWAVVWAFALAICYARDYGEQVAWEVTIGAAAMSGTLIAALLAVRARGLRLFPTLDGAAASTSSAVPTRQFHLKDVLLWTSAAAVLFGVARFASPRFQPLVMFSFDAVTGSSLAIAAASGLWAVLGKSLMVLRGAGLAIVPLACGSTAELFRKSLFLHPWWWYATLSVTLAVCVAVSLFVFRLYGLQLCTDCNSVTWLEQHGESDETSSSV